MHFVRDMARVMRIPPIFCASTLRGKQRNPRRSEGFNWLGCLDSNQEWLNQNQLCCQLHHIPIGMFITVVVNFVPPTGFEPVLAP